MLNDVLILFCGSVLLLSWSLWWSLPIMIGIVTFLWYYGIYWPIEFETTKAGPFYIIYEPYIGPYEHLGDKSIGPCLKKVVEIVGKGRKEGEKTLPETSSLIIPRLCTFTTYYDGEETISSGTRTISGVMLSKIQLEELANRRAEDILKLPWTQEQANGKYGEIQDQVEKVMGTDAALAHRLFATEKCTVACLPSTDVVATFHVFRASALSIAIGAGRVIGPWKKYMSTNYGNDSTKYGPMTVIFNAHDKLSSYITPLCDFQEYSWTNRKYEDQPEKPKPEPFIDPE